MIDIIKIVMFFVVIITIATLIQGRLEKLNSCEGYYRTVFFYSGFYVALMSFFEIFKDELYQNVLYSFNGFLEGIPWSLIVILLVVTVMVPLLISRVIKKDVYITFLRRMNSVIIFLFGILFLLGINITNLVCCVVFLFSLGLAILLMHCKKQPKYVFNKSSFLYRMTLSFVVLGAFFITVIVFPSNELFLHNISEFSLSYGSFLQPIVIGTSLILFGLVLALALLSDMEYRIFLAFTTGFTIMSYIQGTFLNGSMKIIDGIDPKWTIEKVIVNLIIWGIVTILFIYLGIKHEISIKICKYICLYIGMIQILSLCWMGFTMKQTDRRELTTYSLQGMTELHSSKNIIVFILDWYDGQIFDEVVEEQPEIVNILKDFTYYQNTTSHYAFTDLSLPYLITGVEWNHNLSSSEYCAYAFKNSQLLQDVKKLGFDTRIYTDRKYSTIEGMPFINNLVKADIKANFLNTLFWAEGCARYKVSPFIRKAHYLYLFNDSDCMIDIKNDYIIDDIEFYRNIKDSLSINDNDKKGAYRLYHLTGAHPPYVMDDCMKKNENSNRILQGIGSLRIVEEFINQMKDLDIYDDATIIITADHGQNYLNDPNKLIEIGLQKTSNPIMFVKYPKQQFLDKKMQISRAPVSHAEVMPTIIREMGGSYVDYGKTFDQIDEGENRIREFDYYREPDIPLQRYIINGNVRDINSWSIK